VPIEHEAKVLDIDPEMVTACILAVGGEQVPGPRLMRRHVYDIVPGDMSKWIRLRDTGAETTR
jgi:adenylate cyclase class 2